RLPNRAERQPSGDILSLEMPALRPASSRARSLRVVLLSQYFPPEIGATQTRAETFASFLAEAGHQVTVICEFPNHPHGIVPPAGGGASGVPGPPGGGRRLGGLRGAGGGGEGAPREDPAPPPRVLPVLRDHGDGDRAARRPRRRRVRHVAAALHGARRSRGGE